MAWYALDEVEVPHLSASPLTARRHGCRMIADGRDDVDEDETSRTELWITMSKLDELQYAFPESDANRCSLGSADGTASQLDCFRSSTITESDGTPHSFPTKLHVPFSVRRHV